MSSKNLLKTGTRNTKNTVITHISNQVAEVVLLATELLFLMGLLVPKKHKRILIIIISYLCFSVTGREKLT